METEYLIEENEDWFSSYQELRTNFLNLRKNASSVECQSLLKVLLIGLSIVGLVGNILICYVIVHNKSMRRATNYYLISITVSDSLLLFGFIIVTSYGLTLSSPTLGSSIGLPLLITRAVHTIGAQTSIMTTIAISVDRYIAVCHPFRVPKLLNRPRTLKIILMLWVYACVNSVLFTICSENLMSCCKKLGFFYRLEMQSTLNFIIPSLIISVLYAKIGNRIFRSPMVKHNSTIHTHSLKGQRYYRRGLRISGVHPIFSREVLSYLRWTIQVAVVMEFIIRWAPLNMLLMISTLLGRNMIGPNSGVIICVVTPCILCTVVNPFIHVVMCTNFRKAFKDMFCTSGIYSFIVKKEELLEVPKTGQSP